MTFSAGRSGPALEMWGGVECTVNRVGDRWFDQIERSGHSLRSGDLDLFADLGIRTLRYPILWERTAPDGLERADWTWADERLGRLRELGVRPIVTLVHHGSGPRSTDLLDPGFVDGLAAFAGAVAARYPWIDAYTPVNEPVTTARFGALYGHWWPHRHDMPSFLRALITEIRATTAAMRAVRRVNPSAQLIQTEDVGKTFGAADLAYQADYENGRRWLGFDLLTGRVDPSHPLWGSLLWWGLDEDLLLRVKAEATPPDVIGLNYYLTSERFLDARTALYPHDQGEGNGRDAYADVEAVRVRAEGIEGVAARLAETWDRYHLPIAVTEAHLGCTPEEQIRWLVEIWRGTEAARAAGVDVRAVTAWSLLGAFDWASLVTRDDGRYETGAFDIGIDGSAPRPTAVAALVRDLAHGREPTHPALAGPSWWRLPSRLTVAPVCAGLPAASSAIAGAMRPIVFLRGGDGLDSTFARVCGERGLAFVPLDAPPPGRGADGGLRLRNALLTLDPWAIIADGASLPSESAQPDVLGSISPPDARLLHLRPEGVGGGDAPDDGMLVVVHGELAGRIDGRDGVAEALGRLASGRFAVVDDGRPIPSQTDDSPPPRATSGL
ncbi:MAG: family 1 glycosylhydrolase, partial [Thermomicrobiales bacterium]